MWRKSLNRILAKKPLAQPFTSGGRCAWALSRQRIVVILQFMRKASSDDVQRLVALMTEFYAEAAYPLNHERAAEAFVALLADNRLGQVWFIQADDHDVGHVVVTFCYSMEYGGLIAFVDDLFIQKAFRRAGLGTAALAEVRVFCAKLGVRAIQVETGRDNAPALALYRRVGFVDTDRLLLSLPLADPTHAV